MEGKDVAGAENFPGKSKEGGLHLAWLVSPTSWAGNKVPVCQEERALWQRALCLPSQGV